MTKKHRLQQVPAGSRPPLTPQLRDAVQTLLARLHHPQPLRCWGCGEIKAPSPKWAAGAYTPRNPAHPAMAYAVCPACQTRDGHERAALAIETKARELAEEQRGRP